MLSKMRSFSFKNKNERSIYIVVYETWKRLTVP
jgi:hypothetical protein